MAAKKSDEVIYMRLAIEAAKKSTGEDDRIHPRVGVVVVKGGDILGSGSRGEVAPGAHAEYGLLEKLKESALAGATVYTTLEPCTSRNHPKIPCATRLVERKVSRVVVGMLDPNQKITGKGILQLRRAGIAVDLFPSEMMAELEELNRDFIREHETPLVRNHLDIGISEAGLTAFYPSRDHYALLREDAATIDRYIGTAARSITMVSINLMTGIAFHDICKLLRSRLTERSDFRTTISLLNPQRPDLMAVVGPILRMSPETLARMVNESLVEMAKFKLSLPEGARDRIDIRVHNTMPFGSAIVLDGDQLDGRIQIETKPYGAGLQASFAFEISRRQKSGLYEVLIAAYSDVTNGGTSVDAEALLRSDIVATQAASLAPI